MKKQVRLPIFLAYITPFITNHPLFHNASWVKIPLEAAEHEKKVTLLEIPNLHVLLRG